MNRSAFLQNPSSQFVIRYAQLQQKIQSKPKAISVSSDYSLPKRTKRKIILDRSQIISIEKKAHKKSAVISIPTNTDERKDDREYSRVPIEYMDERDSGNPADKIRGRVVYRGYAPKNTFYYFKTVKELKFTAVSKIDKDYRGEDVVFNSKFQSGNLNAAVRMGNKQYWLYMREDTNTHGLRQWFYFEVRSRRKVKLKFRIYKFSKKFSLYRLGMKPYVRTADSQWRQQGQNIVYEYDTQQKCYYMAFQYVFEEHKEVYFAALPPYTYSMMTQYIETLAQDEKVSVRRIGLSLGGLDINSVIIKGKSSKREEKHSKSQGQKDVRAMFRESHNKQAIIVLSRTHPGETVSNWALQSFISKVLDTPALTQLYNFYIVPMVNPDGVFLGNHRTGVLGQDLNRNFHGCDVDYFPQIESVETFVSNIQKKQKIAFLFDLHGHSAKKNIFAFGEEGQIGSTRYLYSRIIPKILANTIDSFKYDHCLFKASKQKKNTARVFFSIKYGLNAITFEQSYGLLENGCIGINNWRNFGTALAQSLLVFATFNKSKLEGDIKFYLEDQIKEEKEAIRKKKQRAAQLARKRQLERQKALEKQREEAQQKSNVAKTQAAQDPPNQSMSQRFFKFYNTKSPKILSHIIEQPYEKRSQTSKNEQSSMQEEQQLSSGDQDLELRQAELQVLKKDIFRVGGINREGTRRELLSMAQKKVQLGQQFVDYTTRLHHKQSTVVQRIFKFKSRQKIRQTQFVPHSQSFRDKSSVQLPAIKR